MDELLPQEVIEQKIYLIRGHKVMLDKDLAKLYGVSTKRLNEQIRRNLKRFPKDFMFQLTEKEALLIHSVISNLRSQIATSSWGGRRYLPYVFTEQGVAMLSSILNSERAIQVNIVIMRVFVKLRHIISTNKDLAHKLNELEHKVGKHDEDIKLIFEAIRQLMEPPPEPPKPRIGFK